MGVGVARRGGDEAVVIEVGGAVVVSAGVVVVSVLVVVASVVVVVDVVVVAVVVGALVVGSVVVGGASARAAAAAAPLPKRTAVASVAISFGRTTDGIIRACRTCFWTKRGPEDDRTAASATRLCDRPAVRCLRGSAKAR